MKLNKIIVINMLVLVFLSACNGGSSSTNQLSNSLTPSAMKPQKSLVIKNGDPVHIPEINALVPLIHIKVAGPHYRVCTGVFLAPNKVLTAAHCVIKLRDKTSDQYFESIDLFTPITMAVIFPKQLYQPVNTNTDKPGKHWNVYPVKGVYVRSDVFAGVNMSDGFFIIADYQGINDLAILELGIAPKYKFHMELASVAPQVNEQQIVVGFGHNDGDNTKKVKDQSHGKAGLLRIGKTIVSDITPTKYPSILRIGGAITKLNTPYVSACNGDSGGPSLVYNESSLTYTITGISSLGYGIQECSVLPNFYMSVAYYKDWIESGYKTDSLQTISTIHY
ncbi:MAG: hypothetical protein RLZZ293_741 [Pseudomonadota bacterium]